MWITPSVCGGGSRACVAIENVARLRSFDHEAVEVRDPAEEVVKHQRFQSPLKIASTLAPPDSTTPEIAIAA
jgi:hypothetical protein